MSPGTVAAQPLHMSSQAGNRRLFASSAVVTALALVNAGLSYMVQRALAAQFGTRREMDAYLAAFALPALIASAIADAVALTLIPVFMSQRAKYGDQDAWRVSNALVTMSAVALSVLAGGLFLVAGPLMSISAPGLTGASRNLAVALLRLMLPMIVCLSLAALLTAIHHAHGLFAAPALASVSNTAVMLAGILLLAPRLGIYGVALGTTMGAAARFLWLAPILGRRIAGGGYLQWRHVCVRHFWRLSLPLILAGFVFKANLVVERFLASWMPEGRISSLGYAYQIALLLAILATQGLGITMLPRMCDQAAGGETAHVGRSLADGIRWVIFILTPVVVGVAVLSEPITRLLLRVGVFDEASVHATAFALLAYLGFVYAGGLANMIARAFIAIQDLRPFIQIGLVSTAVLIVLDVVLARWLGYIGLALAYSVMWFFSLALWLLAVRRRFKAFDWTPTISAGLVALTASAGMAPICWILRAAVLTSAPRTLTELALALLLVATVGAAVYLLLVLLLTRRHSGPADPAGSTGFRDTGSLLETE